LAGAGRRVAGWTPNHAGAVADRVRSIAASVSHPREEPDAAAANLAARALHDADVGMRPCLKALEGF